MLQRFSLDASLSLAQTKLLTALLKKCLENSQDLQSLGAPDATALLLTWKTLHQSEAVLLNAGDENVGLAVVSRESDSQRATLEYIGVSSAFRRRGYGRLLLRDAEALVASDDPLAASNFTAWCDCENYPAMQLYSKCGFTPGQLGQIWLRSVTPVLSTT